MRFSRSTHLLMFLSLETKHKNWLRPQSINYLIRISFAIRNGAGRWVEAKKKFRFFEKNICILPDGYLLLNRCSFNHQCISKIRWRSVFSPLYLCIFFCIICRVSHKCWGGLFKIWWGAFLLFLSSLFIVDLNYYILS